MVTMDGYTLTFYGGIEQIMNLLKTACENIEKINPTFYFSLGTYIKISQRCHINF
jgi:hypothetical protein